jgi:hypothetical protein
MKHMLFLKLGPLAIVAAASFAACQEDAPPATDDDATASGNPSGSNSGSGGGSSNSGSPASSGAGAQGGSLETTIEALQTGAPSTVCPAADCSDPPDYCNYQRVQLSNLVVTSDDFVVSSTAGLSGFMVAEGAGINRSLTIVYEPKAVALPAHPIGTEITSLAGQYSEIFCLTQVEIENVGDFTIGGTLPVPAPTEVTVADLDLAGGEPYESVQVTATGAYDVTYVGVSTVELSEGKASINLTNHFNSLDVGDFMCTEECAPVVDTVTAFDGFVRYYSDDTFPTYQVAVTSYTVEN